MSRRAFTLLELLVVMAIMGMMATASVASYRTMRQGMEESSVVRNASQFVRLCYQRSKIDRVPVNVYFWNETRSVDDNDGKLSVAGRASAVRRGGRITTIDGDLLVDEFGDLEVYGVTDDEGNLDPGDTTKYKDDAGMYLYKVNGDETSFQRSIVSRSTAESRDNDVRMFSEVPGDQNEDDEKRVIASYGYYIQDKGGITWKRGDAYGVEFGDFELPDKYIFGTSFSKSLNTPMSSEQVLHFNPLSGDGGGGQTVQISALRPNAQGELAAKTLDKTTPPDRSMKAQNEE